jgi:hypothetical protein
MARKNTTLLNQLSTADLKRLLAARERIDVLEVEKSRLEKELAKVDGELSRLMSGGGESRKKVRRKKTAKKKAVKKKTASKKAPAKKVTKKKVVKKTVRKKVGKKKSSAKKVVRKKASGKARAKGKLKLEDVVLAVIRKNGSPVAFQDLKATIVKGKLFKTKSGNFDNVLRRTLSTSKAVKRVGRGIYDAA